MTPKGETVILLKIIRNNCASLVAEILTENNYDLGEPTWVPYNVRMTTPYKNVVAISNKCALPANVLAGDKIKIALISEEDGRKTPCAICKMMDYPPAKKINIKFLEKL
jgi:hypothetical protein